MRTVEVHAYISAFGFGFIDNFRDTSTLYALSDFPTEKFQSLTSTSMSLKAETSDSLYWLAVSRIFSNPSVMFGFSDKCAPPKMSGESSIYTIYLSFKAYVTVREQQQSSYSAF